MICHPDWKSPCEISQVTTFIRHSTTSFVHIMQSNPPRLPRLDSKEPYNGPLLHTSYSAAADAAIKAIDAEATATGFDGALRGGSSGSLVSDALQTIVLPTPSERPRTADSAVPPFSSMLSAPSQTDRVEVCSASCTAAAYIVYMQTDQLLQLC